MKIFYCKSFPPKGFSAMAVFGAIIARTAFRPLSMRTVRHEKIHAAQAKDCGGWLPFYVRYLAQWLRALRVHPQNAYHSIPFEREAYANSGNTAYLKYRPAGAWKKYTDKNYSA